MNKSITDRELRMFLKQLSVHSFFYQMANSALKDNHKDEFYLEDCVCKKKIIIHEILNLKGGKIFFGPQFQALATWTMLPLNL
jgi:hypothetical protein